MTLQALCEKHGLTPVHARNMVGIQCHDPEAWRLIDYRAKTFSGGLLWLMPR